MSIRFHPDVRADRAAVSAIITEAARGISLRRVEVHVWQEPPSVVYRLVADDRMLSTPNRTLIASVADRHGVPHDQIEQSVTGGQVWRGWADRRRSDARRPKMAGRPRSSTEYLISLTMAWSPESEIYPMVKRYAGLKSAPQIEVFCWHERLFILAAHEVFHIREFRNGKVNTRNREVRAEKHALAQVQRWRVRGRCTALGLTHSLSQPGPDHLKR